MSRNSAFRASSAGGWSLTSLLRDIGIAWRLLWDPAVPGLLKLVLPILALVYWFSPLDLMPGLPFDDIAVLLLLARTFVAMAPQDSVKQAVNGGSRNQSGTSHRASERDQDSDVIDTTWRVIDE